MSDAEDKSYRVSAIGLDPQSNMQYAALVDLCITILVKKKKKVLRCGLNWLTS